MATAVVDHQSRSHHYRILVLGFGERAPEPVLKLLERCSRCFPNSTAIEVLLERSPGLFLPLLKRGVFSQQQQQQQQQSTAAQDVEKNMDNDNRESTNNRWLVFVYCLPTSLTEHAQKFSSEIQRVRSMLVAPPCSPDAPPPPLMLLYDPRIKAIVTGDQNCYTATATTEESLTVILSLVQSMTMMTISYPISNSIRTATTLLRHHMNIMAANLQALTDLDMILAQDYFNYHFAKLPLQHTNTHASPHPVPVVKGDTVIVVGAGGREHALAVSLAQSPHIGTVICCPGNGGTAAATTTAANRNRDRKRTRSRTRMMRSSTTSTIRCSHATKIINRGRNADNATVLALIEETQAHMVVIGPEAPLVQGLVNDIHTHFPDVFAFGPTSQAAELEASKAFAKDMLQKLRIPTASYETFTDVQSALTYVSSLDHKTDPWPRVVVKASGLAAGKGVLLPTNCHETVEAVQEIMLDKMFGSAGDTCVIERFLPGVEASCLAFCDGKTAKLMPAAQDHKRALDHDQGLNTGGMGAYAPAPCVTPALQAQIEQYCIQIVQHMAERGTPYVGILYAGMMLTEHDGPFVLEFNCRFGDPEAQVLLPLLETDLYEILMVCCGGVLDKIDVRFKSDTTAATVVCAAKGYPDTYPKGMEITGLDRAAAALLPDHHHHHVHVYHAGTIMDEDTNNNIIRCSGGRVLAVTGIGSTLESALKHAYHGVSMLDFVNPISNKGESLMHYRTDIGRRAVEKKLRIGVLGSTRGTALLPVIQACESGLLHAEIVAVVSNKSSAAILEKGRSIGPAVVSCFIPSKGLTRAQYDARCTAAFISAGVDYVLLVGYMRILSLEFCQFWKGRCINVHPSLLPLHAGGMDLEVHQAVIDARESVSGCTIHQVTETVDGGPILLQKQVRVDASDTAEMLKAKVQSLEGPAFVEAIQMYCSRNQQQSVISYAEAGVSVDAGNRLVDMIKPVCKETSRAGCDADLGGFGGLFDLAAAGFDAADTILIGATDGVGTKLKIAQLTKNHETVGIDLVAMCVNDLIVAGGEPLFFLDYFATGHLKVEETAAIIKGIARGCKLAGCGLIGGETAEMPSMYSPGEFDLAGFSVGAVKRDGVLPSSSIRQGDALLGLASSGLHSNGFSLVRKLIEKENLSYESPCPWDSEHSTVGDALLVPTKIYVKQCLPLIKKGMVKGLAHITGGGLIENLPRSLPKDLDADITSHPPLPPVFQWMKRASGLDDTEMLRTFNCGIGMVLIVSSDVKEEVKAALADKGDVGIYELGQLVPGTNRVRVVNTLY